MSSMLKRSEGEHPGYDRSGELQPAQSRAAATGLVTLKGFGSATGYRTAQVSAHVSALASQNNSNNSSQVRQPQRSGAPQAGQSGHKIIYHGQAASSGAPAGPHYAAHAAALGTQLQKHEYLGASLRQAKKQQNSNA